MGALGLDLWGFLVQLIAFALFVLLFWRFALGPITRVLDQRQERVRESLEAAERMKVELAATAQRNEAALAEARQQAQQMRQEVADLSVMAAERILRANLDPAAQQRLIEETLAEAGAPAAGGSGNGTGAGAGAV